MSQLTYVDPDGTRRFRWSLILGQSEGWVDRYGREHRIADMEPRYRERVVRFAERHASRWFTEALFRMGVYMDTAPDGAYWACEHEMAQMEEMDPREWLHERPLIRALKEEEIVAWPIG